MTADREGQDRAGIGHAADVTDGGAAFISDLFQDELAARAIGYDQFTLYVDRGHAHEERAISDLFDWVRATCKTEPSH